MIARAKIFGMRFDSIPELLRTHAEEAPDADALLAPGRPPLTYAGLWHQAQTVTQALNLFGVGRNDRVGVVLANGPEMASAFVSVACAAACAPLNPAYRREEFEFYLSDLEARALVVAAGDDEADSARARRRMTATVVAVGAAIALAFVAAAMMIVARGG